MTKTKEEYNEYMRAYMLKRYHKQREEMIAILGGSCVKCGSVCDLEIDHIDARKKSFDIGKSWSRSKEYLDAELSKCQLLCGAHHTEKSIIDNGHLPAKGTHGTLSAYRYCRCDECKGAMKTYNSKNKEKRKNRSRV